MLLIRQLQGPLVVAQEARQVVVVARVVQLMAPRVVERGSSISSTGGSGAAGGIPVRRMNRLNRLNRSHRRFS